MARPIDTNSMMGRGKEIIGVVRVAREGADVLP